MNTAQKMQDPVRLGINIIPDMPVGEIIDTVQAAEELGYEICLIADEGFMPDVYVALSAAAQKTSRIKLGPVTNGFTRHPAVTALGMATLNELSNGRALVTIVAGGSVVLDPMGIPLQSPLSVVRETVEIMRQLWTGASVSFAGKRFNLQSARMKLPQQEIPIWVAARGPKMLALAGEIADGVFLMGKSDLGPSLDIVHQGEVNSGRKAQRIFLERIAYRPEMLDDSVGFFSHVIMDMPDRQKRSFLSKDEIIEIEKAYQQGGADQVAGLITKEIISRYKVAGTPQECTDTVSGLIQEHQLDVILLNIRGDGLTENIQLMGETYEILAQARTAANKGAA